jgi:wyosine [tRNA(Phe)-imidazoG37] synthetase (radical SAM superfamily)
MNCVYCQLGRTTHLTNERKVYVPTQDILDEIRRVPLDLADYITFAGRGEPTLAKNLGAMIRGLKSFRREKIAVLTNSSMMNIDEVREDLLAAHFVIAKLDASSQSSFEAIDRGLKVDLGETIHGIMEFRDIYKGKLALQIMLVDQNIDDIERIADITRRIGANEVQLDTPLRPSASHPLERQRVLWAKKFFEHMPVVSVFDEPLKKTIPMDKKATISRHGNYRKAYVS